MKKLILLTISIILFNSCEEQEEQFTAESVEENSKFQQIDQKSANLLSVYSTGDYSDAGYADYNRDGHIDHWFVKTSNTRTGYIEIHILDGKSHYNNVLFRRATILRTSVTDGYVFRVGDYNRDRRIDLWALRATGAGTKRLEVHIIDGVANFSTWMINRVTPHPEINVNDVLLNIGDYNNDGWLDINLVDYSGYPNAYIYSLDGRVKFRSYIVNRKPVE